MTSNDVRLWHAAYRLAEAALLRPTFYSGNNKFQIRAEYDPLAAHCLAECIVALAKENTKCTANAAI